MVSDCHFLQNSPSFLLLDFSGTTHSQLFRDYFNLKVEVIDDADHPYGTRRVSSPQEGAVSEEQGPSTTFSFLISPWCRGAWLKALVPQRLPLPGVRRLCGYHTGGQHRR